MVFNAKLMTKLEKTIIKKKTATCYLIDQLCHAENNRNLKTKIGYCLKIISSFTSVAINKYIQHVLPRFNSPKLIKYFVYYHIIKNLLKNQETETIVFITKHFSSKLRRSYRCESG